MVFGGRVRLVGTDGPVTVVGASEATADERARALASSDGWAVLMEVCREAETGGDRHALVDVHRLMDPSGSTRYWTVATTDLVRIVLDGALSDQLLVVDGWLMGDRWTGAGRQSTSPRDPAGSTADDRVGRLLGRELSVDGASYSLASALSWPELRERGGYQVVRNEEARRVLQRLSERASRVDEKDALALAAAELADPLLPRPTTGLFLLRRIPTGGFPAATAKEPAMTPSQVAKPSKAPADDLDWIEIRLQDQDARACGDTPYRLKLADGTVIEGTIPRHGAVRLTGIPKGDHEVEFPKMIGDEG